MAKIDWTKMSLEEITAHIKANPKGAGKKVKLPTGAKYANPDNPSDIYIVRCRACTAREAGAATRRIYE
jgi:hypothetical protein